MLQISPFSAQIADLHKDTDKLVISMCNEYFVRKSGCIFHISAIYILTYGA